MNPPSGDQVEAIREIIRKRIPDFPQLIESYKKDHPNWKAAIALSLLDGGLHRVKSCIDDPLQDEVSWANPYLSFNIPCEFSGSLTEGFTPTLGRISFGEIDGSKSATEILSALLIDCLKISFLNEITGCVASIQTTNGLQPLLTDQFEEVLRAIESEDSRQEHLRSLFRPISYGAGTIEYPTDEEGNPFVDESVYAQLAAINTPLIALPLTVNDYRMQIISIFEIEPLVLDPGTKKGFFRIRVGLALQMSDPNPPDNWFDEESFHLENWPKEDLEFVWGQFSDCCKSIFGELGFKTKADYQKSVVSLETTVRLKPEQDLDAVLDRIKAACEDVGIEFGTPKFGVDFSRGWIPLLESVDLASTNKEKGASLERLLLVLFNSIPGFQVDSNVRTKTEEIDLWIENSSEAFPFSKEGSEILAECKNWNKKIGKDQFVVFREKMRNRRGRCTMGFLISWQGFAKTVVQEHIRTSQDKILVALLDAELIRRAVRQGDFLAILLESRRKALAA